MQRKIVKTIITYDIQTDDDFRSVARDALRDLLIELGYEDGHNQSTMTHRLSRYPLTVRRINSLCDEVDFNDGDEFSIYVCGINRENNEHAFIKDRYFYRSRSNRFE